MFRVVRLDLLIRSIALVTVVLSTGLYVAVQSLWLPDYPLFKVVSLSLVVSFVVVAIALSPPLSRALWNAARIVNRDLFPDLNGTWEGEVTPETGSAIKVRALVRQTLMFTHIDVHGETMKSITLETTPAIEQGQPKLYYVYQCTPKNPAFGMYCGCILFDVRNVRAGDKERLELSGRYYTDRKTVGRLTLRQVSGDASADVSFY